MIQVWLYSIASVLLVSIVSLVGLITFALPERKLKKILLYLVSFSAGVLFGDVFIHLIPEIVESGFSINSSLYVLVGITVGLLTEKVICWRHCHIPVSHTHNHRLAYMNLIGDFFHNFIDGLVIGASYLVSIPVGIATTMAVVFHEIPQEVGDFGVLLHAGYSKNKAIFYNFLTALSAVAGAIIALIISSYTKDITTFMIPFAAGNFIYIAGSDLIPELHKEENAKKGFVQLLFFILGIGIMLSLLTLEK